MTPPIASSLSSLSRSLLAAGAFVLLAVTACSTKNDAVGCDSSQCATGNKCLALAGVTQCRKTCASNLDPATSCPFGYTCVAATDGVEPFCVKDNVDIKKAPTGQWGSACKATGGLDHNPDCDAAQSFWCFGLSPTDGAAYCTHYDCASDRDCGAGFYCATANLFPDVTTVKRSLGDTEKVCLKREYCSPCKVDLDCLPMANRKTHCVADDDGNGFCSPECDKSDACNYDAQCLNLGDYNACYPRAGRCAGDGTLCSPCRSDADCGTDGLCVKGQYTQEKSCAKVSKLTPCKTGATQGTDFDCPTPTNGAKAQIRCLGGTLSEVPPNYCHGLYGLAGSGDIGCWTPNR